MDTALDRWWTAVLAGPGGDLFAADSSEEYLALPRPGDPRVVVDRRSPDAVRDAVDRMVASRTTSGPLKALAGGASSLLARYKPTYAVESKGANKTLRQHLADVLNMDVRLSISVGPPRPNRKPVVRCYGDSGLIAVAKLGPEAHTAKMVENEARWLDVMTAKPLTDVQTPLLVHLGKYGLSALLVMGVLDLDSDLGVDISEVPFSHAETIAGRYGDHVSLSYSAWWRGLFERIESHELRSVLAQMSQAEKDPYFEQLRTGAWHGDWSPWNMGFARSGKLCIWDWERAGIGVPIGFDLIHLHYQYGEGMSAADSALGRLGIPVEHHNLIKRLYLFELCARHDEAEALDTERHAAVISDLSELRK